MNFRLPAVALLFVLAASPAGAQQYDIVLANATIIDGTGAARFTGAVGITGDRIAIVSRTPIPAAQAKRVIDVRGHVVAPGFIDLHAHLEPLLQMPGAESAARQGVTLALGGPDGGGPWPFKPYLDSAEKAGLGINVAFLVGHNTVRREVMATANRAPTVAELEKMKAMIATGMKEGAFGMSTGLRYVPGYYSRLTKSSRSPRSPPRQVASIPRTCAKRGSVSSAASAKRSTSVSRRASRSSSRTTRR